jgi:hypothetical protein
LLNFLQQVYDGANKNAALLWTLCGYFIPPPINSTGNVMFLEFKSDSSLNAKGFSANYYTIS